jgi:hypothetical protein
VTASAVRAVLVVGPFLALGIIAGVLHALSRRTADPRRRRLYAFLWIAALLAGAPLWLFAAVALRLL